MPTKLKMELDRLSISDFPTTGSIVDLPVRPGLLSHVLLASVSIKACNQPSECKPCDVSPRY
jgi:hypothetical protein